MARRKFKQEDPIGNKTSRDEVSTSVKRWVLIPIICFTAAGTGTLFYILYLLTTGSINSEFAWPAIIIAFAGLPSALATQVKNFKDVAELPY